MFVALCRGELGELFSYDEETLAEEEATEAAGEEGAEGKKKL